jgi:hypothetical protein
MARAEELAEEGAAKAATQEEMAWDRRCWDNDMAAARRTREVHELASQRCHRRNLCAPARPVERASTPSIWAGETTCCRRQQDKDGGATTASRGSVALG